MHGALRQLQHVICEALGAPRPVDDQRHTQPVIEIAQDARVIADHAAAVGDHRVPSFDARIQAVAVGPAFAGVDRRPGQEMESVLRQNAAARPRAAIQEHAHVRRQVGRRGGDAAVAGAVLHPGAGHARVVRVRGAVVEQILVADRQARPQVVRQPRHRVRHAERLEDARPDDLGVRLAGDLLEHVAQDLVADVRVAEMLPRRLAHDAFRQGDRLVQRRRDVVTVARQGGGMGHQIVRPDRCVRRLHLEPRQVLRHRRLRVEAVLVAQLQQVNRGERLGDRADLEQVVRCQRPACVEVGVAVGRQVQEPLPVGQRQRHPRDVLLAHLAPDELVQPLPGRLHRRRILGREQRQRGRQDDNAD